MWYRTPPTGTGLQACPTAHVWCEPQSLDMARNAAGASLVASAVLGWTWEADWLLQHRNFGAGINQLVYTVCGQCTVWLLCLPTLPSLLQGTTQLPFLLLAWVVIVLGSCPPQQTQQMRSMNKTKSS